MKFGIFSLLRVLTFTTLLLLNACNKSSQSSSPNPPPVTLLISSLNPDHGPDGSTVTINGTGFSSTLSRNTVKFNGVLANIVQASSTQLVVTVPDHSGTGQVQVIVNGVTGNGPTFTYELSYDVSTFAGNHTEGSQNGIGTAASFGFIWGIATDTAGNIYVADGSYNLIRKISSTAVVTTLAGAGSQNASLGQGTFFYLPVGVAVDLTGKVYVADNYFNRIRVITAPETVSTLAGAITYGYADGIGTSALFFEPTGVAVDNNTGNVFVVDQGNNMIRKITPSGVVTTFAGMGSAHVGSVDGVGTAASFWQPNGIAIDSQGNMYIADAANSKIRKITPAGVVTTFAGGGSVGGETDGPGNIATFAFPQGLAVDSTGNVYVADYGNNKIRKITPLGFVSSIAGTGVAGSTDGIGSVAQFNGPMGVAIGGNGILYVADGKNNVIRKIVMH